MALAEDGRDSPKVPVDFDNLREQSLFAQKSLLANYITDRRAC